MGPLHPRADSPPKLEPLYAKNVAGAVGGHSDQGDRDKELAYREQKGKGFEGEQKTKKGGLELSEFVDKRSPMTKEYKEMKKKEHEARERKKKDEERQKQLYDEGFFFMTWIRVSCLILSTNSTCVYVCTYVCMCTYMQPPLCYRVG